MGHRYLLSAMIPVALLTLACAGTRDAPGPRRVPGDALWRTLEGDSLAVQAYLDLSESDKQEHGERAALLSGEADAALAMDEKLNLLAMALTEAPARLDDWLRLVSGLMVLGELDLALEYLDVCGPLVRLQPPEQRRGYRLAIDIRKAWIYRDRAQSVRMRNHVERCVQLDPGARETMMLQGLEMADRGDVRGANNVARDIESINRMRQDWRSRFEWRWIRGMAEVAGGRLPEAIAWMQRARPESQYAPRFFRDLGDICARAGERQEARLYYGLGFEALGLGDIADLRMFDSHTEAEVGYPYWTYDDFNFVAGSRRAFAVAAVDSFHVSMPGERRIRWADTAAGMLSICIRSQLDVDNSRAQRGMVYVEVGALELAEIDLSRVRREAAGEVRQTESLVWLGYVYLQQERAVEAAEVLGQATQLQQDNARAWSYLGCAQMATGDENAGLQSLNRAISLSPDLPEAWFNRGLYHFRGHRWAEAARDLERALELAPGNTEILPMLQQSKVRIRRAQTSSP